jgi:3-hydroxyanthranilate 3,4-dioxygenase
VSQLAPLNLHRWIEEHRHLLQPPVGNAMIWNSQFMVMVVGGPNQRADFHVNPGEEFFFQVEGDIVLRVIEGGRPREIPIRQGEMFLLPGNIPHSPQRPAGTVGLVIEHRRAADANDHLRWYCPHCGAVLHDAEFHLVDLGKQLKPLIEEFQVRRDLRTCKSCDAVFEVQPPAAAAAK